MGEDRFVAVTNARTHLAVDAAQGRVLGGAGSNFYRCWVFPLYTPSGLSVTQEFPFDHPFHNGVFVGQHPVRVGEREANFWVMPPMRSADDRVFTKVGRMDCPERPQVSVRGDGVEMVFKNVWRDEHEDPMVDEVRTVTFRALDDATVCDVMSEKIASYGAVEFPQTKYGSIGVRVEPRLLPPMGGVIIADEDRRGTSAVVHLGESVYVAYENELAGRGRFGVMMYILDEAIRGPWFVRDYGMAMYNPTLACSLSVPEGCSWKVSLRVVAYDGEVTNDRATRWMGLTGSGRGNPGRGTGLQSPRRRH